MTPLFLPAMAIASCLGRGKAATAPALFAGARHGLVEREGLLADGRSVPVGALAEPLPALPAAFACWDSRNNRLLRVLAAEIADDIEATVRRCGPERVAVIIGTSTSGIAEGEAASRAYHQRGAWPEGYHYQMQETGGGAVFLARWLGITGPAYVIATACSSSAKVFAAARRLIRCGVVDAAVIGGADTLCRLTVNGFRALESLSPQPCNPFSANRDGITIGEGGALFVIRREPAEVALLGVGETSDAHHISAPDPQGLGAAAAMARALADAGRTTAEIGAAGIGAADIGYLNLHGTATPLNDAMESRAVHGLFGPDLPCSSTKAITGHTLGAAGAVEAAFLWLTLSAAWNPERLVPPHRWDGVVDETLPRLALASLGARLPAGPRVAACSNSFAFGGSNCSLVLGRGWV